MPQNLYITASCLISDHAVYQDEKLVFADAQAALPEFLLSAYQFAGEKYPKFFKMDHLSKLGWLASEMLLKTKRVSDRYKPADVGIVLANSSSSLDTDLRYFKTVKTIASPSLFVYTLPNIVIGEICIRNGFKGENAFFVFEEFDANFMHYYTESLFAANVLQAGITGWVEVLGEKYKAMLVLVEKEGGAQPLHAFTAENLLKIYHGEHGQTNG